RRAGAEPHSRARVSVVAIGLVANGRADPQLLCDGGRNSARTAGRSERHRSAAKPRFLLEPGPRGHTAGIALSRRPFADLRGPEDRLRCLIIDIVPHHPTPTTHS